MSEDMPFIYIFILANNEFTKKNTITKNPIFPLVVKIKIKG